MWVMRLVLHRSLLRRRQPFRVAMACSPRQRILAWLLL
ncbi:transposase [Streptomyces anulatus]|nr:transposase [Streptomyces anulatus]